MLQIGKKYYLKKNDHELVYEECQIVFILIQLNSCSFNLVNPRQKFRFHQIFAGSGVGAGVRKNGRGLPGPGLGPGNC